jgi:3-oxoacyl-[acyl-carrier-protein] synthase-3
MGIVIKDIQYALPRQKVTNSDLEREMEGWDMSRLAPKTGVLERYIASADETSASLGIQAARKLLDAHPGLVPDTLIVCTQTPDYPMPPNSCLIQDALKLPNRTLCFDFNLACSGYIYGLLMAKAFLLSGQSKQVLLITGDTYSRLIHPSDRSTRVLFGDGVAASLIVNTDASNGILDIICDTDGSRFNQFYIPAGGCLRPSDLQSAKEYADSAGNIRSDDFIQMNGMGVLSFFQKTVPAQIREILFKNQLSIEDIELFLFHQASKLTIDAVAALLKISQQKVFCNLERVGNTVSASIPIAWADARKEGREKPGSLLLLSGFGVGLSWGSIIYKSE